MVQLSSFRTKRSLETLRRREALLEEQATAAKCILRELAKEEAFDPVAYWGVLSWILRHRHDWRVVGIASELARLDVREVAELGVAIVMHARTPAEVAVGRALFGCSSGGGAADAFFGARQDGADPPT